MRPAVSDMAVYKSIRVHWLQGWPAPYRISAQVEENIEKCTDLLQRYCALEAEVEGVNSARGELQDFNIKVQFSFKSALIL